MRFWHVSDGARHEGTLSFVSFPHFASFCAFVQQVQALGDGISFTLPAQKAECYIDCIRRALQSGTLSAGMASKLCGRLNWATQLLFHRMGRAMLRPAYAQKRSRTGKIGTHLRGALEWWLAVLQNEITEVRAWHQSNTPICHMFVDAASTPARCAAVLFIGNQVLYTDAAPCSELMGLFCERGDKQIMGLARCLA